MNLRMRRKKDTFRQQQERLAMAHLTPADNDGRRARARALRHEIPEPRLLLLPVHLGELLDQHDPPPLPPAARPAPAAATARRPTATAARLAVRPSNDFVRLDRKYG